MNRVSRYIKQPSTLLIGLLRRISPFVSDATYLKLRYRLETGRKLNLNNPQRFTEKIQWLKLWYRKPEFTILVDKLAAKEYVADRIGNEYIIPTLCVWDEVDQIDLADLPQQFVLKTTHGGGSCGVVVCKDKDLIDPAEVKSRLKSAMKSDIYSGYREWPYKNVPRKILAEKYMSNANDNELTDYKFYCFNGHPKYCQVIANRHTDETIDFYDMDWNHQPFYGLFGRGGSISHANQNQQRPKHLDEMIEIARELASNLPFLRVDLYEINGKVYFGEMTFYPASGLGSFTPDEWDWQLGQSIDLPIRSNV